MTGIKLLLVSEAGFQPYETGTEGPECAGQLPDTISLVDQLPDATTVLGQQFSMRQWRRVHDCHDTGRKTSLFIHLSRQLKPEQVQKQASKKIRLWRASPGEQSNSFWFSSSPKQTTSLSKGYTAFCKLFIPSLSNKQKWLRSSLSAEGQRRGVNKVQVALSLRQKTQILSCEVTCGERWGKIPRPVPARHQEAASHVAAPWTGSDGGLSGNVLGWISSKLETLKPLNTLLPLYSRTAVEAPDAHQNKYCLGSIFFQKTQARLK